MATYPASVDHHPGPVIYGQVTESGHTPLTRATLTLTDLSGRQLDRDFSGTDGHYRLGPPGGGSYLVIYHRRHASPVSRWSRWQFGLIWNQSLLAGVFVVGRTLRITIDVEATYHQ